MNLEKPPLSKKVIFQPALPLRADLRREIAAILDVRAESFDRTVRAESEVYGDHVSRKPELTEFQYGKLNLQYVGVHHTAETMAQYRDMIESAIAHVDVVVIEASIETSGLATQFTVAKRVRQHNPRMDSARIVDTSYLPHTPNTNSGPTFFFEVENIAKKHAKQLITLDPYSDFRLVQSLKDHGQNLSKLDTRVAEYSQQLAQLGEIMAFASSGVATADGIRVGIGDTVRAYTGKQQPTEEEIASRRRFLKRTASLTAGFALGMSFLKGGQQNTHVITDQQFDPEANKLFQYHMVDYRDVVIATGLDRLENSLTKEMKVAILYGANHQTGNQYYLEHPAIRQAKYDVYKPYRDIAPPILSIYQYDLDPMILSGARSVSDTPEADWGKWRTVVREPV